MYSRRRDRTDLLPEDLWSVTMSTDDTQTTVVRDGSGQLWPTGDVHSYKTQVLVSVSHPRTSYEQPNSTQKCIPASRIG